MTPVVTPPVYDGQNESEFRRQVADADGQNLKNNVAFGSFLMLDQVDGMTYRVTMVSGVLTVTAA